MKTTVAWKYRSVLSPTMIPEDPVWRFPLELLNTLGSFASDIGLLQYISCHPTEVFPPEVREQHARTVAATMHIEYCVDQHTFTDRKSTRLNSSH